MLSKRDKPEKKKTFELEFGMKIFKKKLSFHFSFDIE